jgi:glycosyltransferase involved in cell wall biosynthesis
MYRKADAVVAVSCGIADDLAIKLGFPRENIEVICNPVITPNFWKNVGATAYPYWSKNDSIPLITFVGRLSQEKQVDHLIRSFALLRKQQAARLLIIGEGDKRQELEALVQSLQIGEWVHIPGFLSNPLPIIRDSDVLVLPSAHEGLGNVLIEAMGCGTQVISTDCPHGPAEILENGRWGQLVPVDSEEALCHAILRSVKREFWVEPEALKARASYFAADAAVDRYLALLGLYPHR